MTTAERKAEHIRICLEKAVETDHADNGLSAYRFDHDALPDLDFDEVRQIRNAWQFFRDRRPETYGDMVKLLP